MEDSASMTKQEIKILSTYWLRMVIKQSLNLGIRVATWTLDENISISMFNQCLDIFY